MSTLSQIDVPWLEKYRPQTLNDVVGNKETVSRLRALAAQGNCPNLILAGPPGTGKTTSVTCLAKQLLGDSYKDAVLELNASDERGIEVVRNKIKQFAQRKVTLPPGRHKIIILDEADSMTPGAQQALRRTMEVKWLEFSVLVFSFNSFCQIIRFSHQLRDLHLHAISPPRLSKQFKVDVPF